VAGHVQEKLANQPVMLLSAIRSTIKPAHKLVQEFVHLVLPSVGKRTVACKQNHKAPSVLRIPEKHPERCIAAFDKEKENDIMMNKALFEENWKLIRGQINTRWSLMVEYDLLKVDKAEVKFNKFVTMLQVKYGYTRQKAKEEIGNLWTEYESKN
jgi:hypothetical protein